MDEEIKWVSASETLKIPVYKGPRYSIRISGKCQQELGEAEAAERLYDSAIAKDPDQLTAWQGKAKLCEQVMDKAASSTGETRAKLSACYKKLATHHLEKVQRAASNSVKVIEHLNV